MEGPLTNANHTLAPNDCLKVDLNSSLSLEELLRKFRWPYHVLPFHCGSRILAEERCSLNTFCFDLETVMHKSDSWV